MDDASPRYAQGGLRGNKSPLPPIVREKDRQALKEVQTYIDTELAKIGCMATRPDDHRYWIYSTAFSKLINSVTVYKDILSDIKREYEDCITALKNGQREAKYLQVQIKTMSSLPTTIQGYIKRQEELEKKLEILHEDNRRLEKVLDDLLKAEEDENRSEESVIVVEQPTRVEQRPIPGLPVIDWTNEKTLKAAVQKLDATLEELDRQKKMSYVPVEKKEEMYQEFKEKMQEKERLAEEYKEMKKKHRILKLANEAVAEYKDKLLHKRGESLCDFILARLKYSIGRKSSLIDTQQTGFEDDDPAREKEAEMILEYIDKFNELFYEGDYAKAAIHAAISPRGVLRAMETLNRFKEANENFIGTPSPLLMFAEAFMYSSSAQNHYADEEMSFECVNCALKENRPDMVLHWVAQGCVKSCKKVADILADYANMYPEHKGLCTVAAQKMYAETDGCKILAAAHLHKLGQVAGMLEYTNDEKFTQEIYFDLIKECLDERLVWTLCQTTVEKVLLDETPKYTDYVSPLPLPLSLSLLHLKSAGDAGKEAAVKLLDEIYNGDMQEDEDDDEEGDDRLLVASDLSKLIFEEQAGAYETDAIIRKRWKLLASECEDLGKTEVGIDIRAAVVVRKALNKALSAIAEDEKEQFDYYT